jgi:hypothetical protein
VSVVNPGATAIYFWTFLVIVVFLMFNMVLTVVMETYKDKSLELMEDLKRREKLKTRNLKSRLGAIVRQTVRFSVPLEVKGKEKKAT